MKRIGILGLLLMRLMFTCCTAWADGGNAYAVVHNPDAADRLNLRAAPNKEAESLGKYYNGVWVQILEELNNGWVRVRIGNRGVAEGYMMKAYLQYDNTQAVAAAMPTYTSTSSAWELYQTRDVNGAYDMHGYGETVTLLGLRRNGGTFRFGNIPALYRLTVRCWNSGRAITTTAMRRRRFIIRFRRID